MTMITSLQAELLSIYTTDIVSLGNKSCIGNTVYTEKCRMVHVADMAKSIYYYGNYQCCKRYRGTLIECQSCKIIFIQCKSYKHIIIMNEIFCTK